MCLDTNANERSIARLRVVTKLPFTAMPTHHGEMNMATAKPEFAVIENIANPSLDCICLAD